MCYQKQPADIDISTTKKEILTWRCYSLRTNRPLAELREYLGVSKCFKMVKVNWNTPETGLLGHLIRLHVARQVKVRIESLKWEDLPTRHILQTLAQWTPLVPINKQ